MSSVLWFLGVSRDTKEALCISNLLTLGCARIERWTGDVGISNILVEIFGGRKFGGDVCN